MAEKVPLREYFEAKHEALEAQIASTAKELERRLDEMNRLRHQIEEERGHYITTARYDEKHEDLSRRLSSLERWQANLTGRMVGLGLIGAAFIAVVAAFITHLLS